MTNDDPELDELFRRYRDSCSGVEPSAKFMPGLWQKIESRYSFWFVFQRLARPTMTACAALCLVLLLLNFMAPPSYFAAPTYVDALMADHTAEKTYYTEAIRSTPPEQETTRVVLHQ
jgi:hypothetical protein